MMLETIRHNDTGNLVKAARYLMGNAKLGEANGTFDATFVSSVCAYQSNHGLTSDGIIGPKTWAALAAGAPTCSTSKNRTSAATCALQLILGNLDADGIFGTKTKKAVAAFQSANGLSADGICGAKTWAALITGTSSGASAGTGAGTGQTTENGKTFNNCVHYLQWDSRWKNVKYSTHTSSQTIGNSGCGPSSMAMIMATMIDKNITPVEMCKLSVDNGFRTYNSGTAWSFFQFVFKKYEGFSKFIATSSVETLKAALKQGALAVCSMNSNDNGYWTKGGHFITAIGFDEEGYIYANDPNKSAHPRKQLQTKFKSCMKQAFIFWPLAKEESKAPSEETKVEAAAQSSAEATAPVRGEKIVDISKWQETVDYDKLITDTSLIILRASCGSDLDVLFDKHASALKTRGVPFGVYCYSYAGTDAKAKDEAQKIVKYASGYNPLFYVIDAEETRITHDTIATFVNELRAQGVNRVGCYVGGDHYKAYNYDDLRSLFDFTWVPRYGKNDGNVPAEKYYPQYACDLWQYTSVGRVDGINDNVDMNVITGTGKSLNWFLGGDA